MPIVKKVDRLLTIKLTEAELRARSLEQQRAIGELDALEEEKADTARRFADDIKAKNKAIREFKSTLESGMEQRTVECEERFVDGGMVRLVRLDTGELVNERPQTKDERDEVAEAAQGALFGGGLVLPLRVVTADDTGDKTGDKDHRC